MAEVHLDAHGGDVEKSLAAVSAGKSTRANLARLGDRDVNATLGHFASALGSTNEGESDRTSSYAVGSATSEGQRFRVLRPHARGGLGEVFVALDAELNREVALKQILNHHADDPTSRTRFVLEAEVTGGLEHPGIVPVYGLGSYSDGRPYYAMRFVRGDSLKEAIAAFHSNQTLKNDPGRRSLELRKLLRRFVDVCNAIDYAHTRGVLHRDIKPANVILGKHGETLVVDWGLARARGKAEPGSSSDERTLMPSSASGSAETLPGSAMGTPAYMSPEQAAGDLDRLGPRSDVYSLGASLFCLLSGTPPFEGDDLGAILRAVGKGEFPAPRMIDPSIDRALEAVCLKAMALKAENRFATARELADDVERWAADEPVTAWAEPWTRKLLRWLTRHRTGVTGVGAAVIAGVVGLTAVLAVQAQANGRLQQANDLVRKANTDLQAANEREKQRFALAQEAIRTYHTGVSEDILLKQEGFEALRTKLLRGARDFYRKLEDLLQGQADRDSRKALGFAYLEIAEITSAIESRRAAVAVLRNTVALFETLSQEDASDLDARGALGRAWCKLASHLRSQDGGRDESHAALGRAREILEPLANTQPPDAQARLELADVYEQLALDLEPRTGHGDEGIDLMARAREILEDQARANPSDIRLLSRLASLCSSQGLILGYADRMDEAIAAHQRGCEVLEGLIRANPTDARLGHALARGLGNLAIDLDTRKGARDRERLAILERAAAVCEAMAKANPTVLNFPRDLTWIDLSLALTLTRMGREHEARTRLEEALVLRERLLKTNPNDIRHQTQLHEVLLYLGALDARAGRLMEAREARKQATEVEDRLIRANRGDPTIQNDLASDLTNSSDVIRQKGQNGAGLACEADAEAAEGYKRAIAIRERIVKEHPEVSLYRGHLAYTLRRYAQIEQSLGRSASAVSDTRRAVDLLKSLSINDKDDELWWDLACGHAALAGLAPSPGSGLSEKEGTAEADRALLLLQRQFEARARGFDRYRYDPALDSLRARPEFQLLMMDWDFPAEPFAQ